MKQTIDTLAITESDVFLMGKGEWYRSYEKLGAHPATVDGVKGYRFAVWAPDAHSVRVMGSFNDWNENQIFLECSPTGGIWTTFVPGVVEGDLYKYIIEGVHGKLLYKADPYAFWAECPPGNASRTFDLEGYKWGDAAWLKSRREKPHMERPLNIYEVHLGSWKRHDDGLAGNGDEYSDDHSGSYLSYDELSEELVSYVKDMGYSHIELLPVMEHPFDGSWGYQTTGYFAPTTRYGTPHEFMHFVDACHQAGIGVILDWTPGGFCRDEFGLVRFTGTKLYEKEEHPNWGTFKFDYGRGEVRSFLVSNALYWFEKYHADGIRVDGVTSMLYLNFGVDDPGQKKFNERGTEEDLVAIEFVQQLNDTVGEYYPDVMMIAEESTAWPLVTYPPTDGGLGFHYKWDMGWMHDTLHYCQTDFPWRPGNHRLLTFSSMYQFNENFVLPLSHDEVVHGKCSLIGRMPGDYWRQFAGMRALALYQMCHPGAKLNFMGNEIAQFIEWRYYEGIEFFMADEYEAHGNQQRFVRALNHFYLDNPAFWRHAYDGSGFEWVDADNAEQSIISFVRHGDDGEDLVILINFDVAAREDFRMGVPYAGTWREVFNSDAEEFGGSGVINGKDVKSEPEPWNGREDSVTVRVPPLGGMVLKCVRRAPTKKDATKATTAAGTKAKAKAPSKAKSTAAKAATAAKKATAKKPAAKKATTTSTTAAKKATGASTAAGAKKTTAAKKAPAEKASASKKAAAKK